MQSYQLIVARPTPRLRRVTAALRSAGTSATTANPVQGVTDGIALPVLGTVSVGNFPGTQVVSGTFFQTTQPVSGTVTSNISDGFRYNNFYWDITGLRYAKNTT